MAITDLILSPVARLRSAAGSVAWQPSVDFARRYITSLLRQIEVGQLQIVDTTGRTTTCGKEIVPQNEPATELSIHNDTFWLRMLLFADMVCLPHCRAALAQLTQTRALQRASCWAKSRALT